MGWFDLAVLIFMAVLIFLGYRRGLVTQIFGLAGLIVALVAAFSFFGQAGEFIAGFLPIGEELGGVLGFILIVVIVNGLFAFAAARWRAATKSTALSLVDSIGGAVFGGLKALFALVVIIVILVSLPIPALRRKVEEGFVTARILQAAPIFYILQERSLPPNVPRLLITSQGVQLRRINFAELDGAVCLACGGKAKYQGFVRKGLLSYPRFECQNPRCGLASDGCLTFHGYHRIYNHCPLDKANRGESLNCNIWPSPVPVVPKGACPVCGQR